MRLSLLKKKNHVLKRLARAVLGPVGFARDSGYSRSCLKGFAVDRHGEPIPMFTYPMVDLLLNSTAYFPDKDVLEFGSGQSTRWWARHARTTTAVEYNADFGLALQEEFQDNPSVEILLGDAYLELPEREYDVISIDGFPRVEAARVATRKSAPKGIVIVDNTDVQSISEIGSILGDAGFTRVDFFGYSPAAYFKQCTSLFFRDPEFLNLHSSTPAASRLSYSKQLQ